MLLAFKDDIRNSFIMNISSIILLLKILHITFSTVVDKDLQKNFHCI